MEAKNSGEDSLFSGNVGLDDNGVEISVSVMEGVPQHDALGSARFTSPSQEPFSLSLYTVISKSSEKVRH